jgi:peptidoglycan/xylan/chitin deacetylase (PgdA/CDA1 family)
MLVLCYHAISDEWANALAVTPRAFERQLRSLVLRRFRPVNAGEALERRGRVLHVTFDDAYKSVLRATPVLHRLRVPATVFAVSSHAARGRPLDVPELTAEVAAEPRHLATLDWEELRDLAAAGTEIGSHTVTHPHLPQLLDAELDRELRESKVRCEDEIGKPCRFLAYPYGEHDARVRRAACRAGYEGAFALGPGVDESRYAIPRVGIYRRDSLLRATMKTSPVGGPASRIRARARDASARSRVG